MEKTNKMERLKLGIKPKDRVFFFFFVFISLRIELGLHLGYIVRFAMKSLSGVMLELDNR